MRPCAGPIGQNKPNLMWIDSAKLLGPFLVLLMVLGGCAGGLGDKFEPGTRAMDFTLEVYQGEDELGGSKVQFEDIIAKDIPIVLNFWAALCPPCKAEMPELQKMHDEYEGKILVLGLDVGKFSGLGSNTQGRALLNQVGVTYPAGTTDNDRVMEDYEILGMPTTLFIRSDGYIQRTWIGTLTPEKTHELVDSLISSSDSL